MALGAALVDRGRELRREPLAQRVEGSTVFTGITEGEWFKCRLTINDLNEANDPDGGRPVAIHGLMLFGIKDTGGNVLALRSGSRVEVTTSQPELGGSYELTARPKPLRKRRRVIGWEVPVARVEEEPFTSPLP